MKKYGRFIVGSIAFVITLVCILTSSIIFLGPAWLEITHAVIGLSAVLVFAVTVANWYVKVF